MTPENRNIQNLIFDTLKNNTFTKRIIVDTPTTAFQVVNRQYVTLNGSTANRPTSSVVGQYYLDTTVGKPLWWNGTGWIDATGTYH